MTTPNSELVSRSQLLLQYLLAIDATHGGDRFGIYSRDALDDRDAAADAEMLRLMGRPA